MIKKIRLPNNKIQVTFSVSPEKNAQKVALVGEFNNWNANATPMQYIEAAGGGVWRVTLELDADRKYQYRYVVNGSSWINDADSDGQAVNDRGGYNSILNLEKSGLPVQIDQPYANTPYEKLSHPEVGVITPNSNNNDVRQQKTKMIRAQKLDPRTAAELSDRVNGLKRLEVDVFLCCTFDITQDLDNAMRRYGNPRVSQMGKAQYLDGLPYWKELALPEISLDELTITHSSAYDDLDVDFQTVEFDL